MRAAGGEQAGEHESGHSTGRPGPAAPASQPHTHAANSTISGSGRRHWPQRLIGQSACGPARLKDTVDLNSVRGDLAGVVSQVLEPAHVSVWVSERG